MSALLFEKKNILDVIPDGLKTIHLNNYYMKKANAINKLELK